MTVLIKKHQLFTGWNIDDILSLDSQFALAQVLQSVGALQ